MHQAKGWAERSRKPIEEATEAVLDTEAGKRLDDAPESPKHG
jgi:hypothetical protein